MWHLSQEASRVCNDPRKTNWLVTTFSSDLTQLLKLEISIHIPMLYILKILIHNYYLLLMLLLLALYMRAWLWHSSPKTTFLNLCYCGCCPIVSVDDTSHDWQLMDGTHCVVTIAAELAHSAIAHNSHHKRSVMMIIMKSKLLILWVKSRWALFNI